MRQRACFQRRGGFISERQRPAFAHDTGKPTVLVDTRTSGRKRRVRRVPVFICLSLVVDSGGGRFGERLGGGLLFVVKP